MSIYTLIGLILLTAMAAFTVRDMNKPAAVNIAVAGGAVAMLALIAQLSGIVDEVRSIASGSGLELEYAEIMLKAVGISYLAQIAAELCRDMEENALAAKAEIAGRIMLLSLAVPIIRAITDTLTALIRLNA